MLTQAFDQRYLLSIGTRIVIWSIAAVSLNMILGYGGMVSFGHAVFFGIGGYAVGILSHHGVAERLDPVAGRHRRRDAVGRPGRRAVAAHARRSTSS